MNWSLLWAQLFNGLTLGALLVLVAMGLTIIFGALGVINFAHGAFYMVGAYAGYVAYNQTHSFMLAVTAGRRGAPAAGRCRRARIDPLLLPKAA